MKQRLAGKWTTATGSVGGYYTFTPDGRDTTAGSIREPNYTFIGDGTYSIRGNVIMFTADNNKSRSRTNWYWLEQESKAKILEGPGQTNCACCKKEQG